MERLTEKYNGKNIVKSGHIAMVFNSETGNRFEGEAVDKLSAYEDAEEQGLLLRLPCKVVQQLEERTAFLKDCTKYGNKTAEQQSKSYDTMMMYEVKDLVDDLLEIVKAGGTDAEH